MVSRYKLSLGGRTLCIILEVIVVVVTTILNALKLVSVWVTIVEISVFAGWASYILIVKNVRKCRYNVRDIEAFGEARFNSFGEICAEGGNCFRLSVGLDSTDNDDVSYPRVIARKYRDMWHVYDDSAKKYIRVGGTLTTISVSDLPVIINENVLAELRKISTPQNGWGVGDGVNHMNYRERFVSSVHINFGAIASNRLTDYQRSQEEYGGEIVRAVELLLEYGDQYQKLFAITTGTRCMDAVCGSEYIHEHSQVTQITMILTQHRWSKNPQIKQYDVDVMRAKTGFVELWNKKCMEMHQTYPHKRYDELILRQYDGIVDIPPLI